MAEGLKGEEEKENFEYFLWRGNTYKEWIESSDNLKEKTTSAAIKRKRKKKKEKEKEKL